MRSLGPLGRCWEVSAPPALIAWSASRPALRAGARLPREEAHPPSLARTAAPSWTRPLFRRPQDCLLQSEMSPSRFLEGSGRRTVPLGALSNGPLLPLGATCPASPQGLLELEGTRRPEPPRCSSPLPRQGCPQEAAPPPQRLPWKRAWRGWPRLDRHGANLAVAAGGCRGACPSLPPSLASSPATPSRPRHPCHPPTQVRTPGGPDEGLQSRIGAVLGSRASRVPPCLACACGCWPAESWQAPAAQ